jgi:putative intracellular protease/amidase
MQASEVAVAIRTVHRACSRDCEPTDGLRTARSLNCCAGTNKIRTAPRGVVDIDFTGPGAIFGSVMLPGGDMTSPFHQYSVAETKAPSVTGSGLTVVPDYTFETAPQPQVIVIPAQKDSAVMLQWIRKSSVGADVTMSVCVGAYVLAKTGLLDGKSATTHHDAYKDFTKEFPKVHVVRGARSSRKATLLRLVAWPAASILPCT